MGRTDGVRPGSRETRVQDAFYPANDDVIKVYHSNISASRLAVWKGYNDPVIQTGWNFWEDHRDGISIEQLHVIHSRYKRSGEYMLSAQARATLERRCLWRALTR